MELVKQKLFQYAVILHPTKEKSEKGNKSKLLVEPKVVLGNDEKSVGMQAVKAIPSEYDDKLDQIEVVVKSF